MCEEESDDHEAVAKLLEINDSMHRTVERYRLIKKGDVEGAARIPQGTLGISGVGVRKGADNELSLIDFGGPEEQESQAGQASSNDLTSSQANQPAPKGNYLEDDLLGLSLGGDSPFGQGAAISLGSSNGMASMSGPSRQAQQQQPLPQTVTSSVPTQNTQASPASKPNYDPFGLVSSSQPSSKPTTPAPNLLGQQRPAQQQQAQQHRADPFASLSSTSRTASPFQFQQSTNPPSHAQSQAQPQAQQQQSSSLLGDLQSNGTAASGTTKPNADDEWTFSSSLPAQTQDLTVTNSAIRTVFHITRASDANDWLAIESRISNNTAQTISDLTFQLAVTKVKFPSTLSLLHL